MNHARARAAAVLAVGVGLLLASLAAGCQPADAPPTPDAASARPAVIAARSVEELNFMPVDQVRPGMTGYGVTVFAGARPERFDVEVLSVLRNYEPGNHMILIRCSGHDLEKTGIAAGMSGSPIYINGKLIGALAFGWSFSSQPIAGVQPIEQMLRNSGLSCELPPCEQEIKPVVQAGRTGKASEPMLAVKHSAPADGPGDRRVAESDPARLVPLATPLMVSGGSEAALAGLRQRLAGTRFVALKSGGAGGDDPRMADARIEPGGTVAIPLLAGDLDVSAVGTVTTVIGDRVLAFGHPMFNEGPVNLPMATGIIHTFIPSLQSSFKMGSAGPVVGAVRRDESASILGVTGQTPFMSPMTVRVEAWNASKPKVYNFRVADDYYFTSVLASYAPVASATADHGTPPQLTVHYDGQIKFRGFEQVYRFGGIDDLSDNYGWSGPSWDLQDRLYMPIEAMLNNQWGKAVVESIEVNIRLVNQRTNAALEDFRLERDVLLPGEPAVMHLRLARYRQAKIEKTLTVALPADLPDGQYSLTLASADEYRSLMRQHNPKLFQPENMGELLNLFCKLAEPRDDRYYVVLSLPEGGVVTTKDNRRMPNLPASRALILQQTERIEMLPYSDYKVYEFEMGAPVGGGRQFTITIDRDRDKRR